jgi:cation:H+ antiporter
VAYGTSAPELAVGVQAGLNGQPGIALGNVIGSNVFNVLFVLGLCALITPLVVKQELVRRDVPVMIGVSAGLIVVALSGSVSRVEGLVLLAGVVLYSFWVIRASRAAPDEPAEEDAAPPAAIRVPRNLGLVVAGLAMLVLGGRWLVDGAVEIAEVLGLSEVIIGLTVVAIGTSLPEVATSLVAIRRGERDLAVGNVVGSNIFNVLLIVGATAVVTSGGIDVPRRSCASTCR